MPAVDLRITRSELMQAGRLADGTDGHAPPAETQRYIIHRMKKAGIPVLGEIFFLDIEKGKLTVEKSDGGWDIAWRY